MPTPPVFPGPSVPATGAEKTVSNFAVGIDLGGTSVKTVAILPDGQLVSQFIVDYDPADKRDWALKIKTIIDNFEKNQSTPASWIGISAPGLVDKEGQAIAFMPGRFQGLENLKWREYLQTSCAVQVLNDAHSALLGEAWFGAARGYHNVILLTLGTGVGGAILCDGRLLRGQIGRAGHLGHLCLDPSGIKDIVGTPGSLEDAIGNATILARSRGKFATTHALLRAHLEGDSDASEVWMKSIKALGCAIVSMINICDPEAVILGGGIAQCGEALFNPLQKIVDQYEWRPGGHQVKILPAMLGEYAGAFGAAYFAMMQSGVKTEDGAWHVDYVPYVRRS